MFEKFHEINPSHLKNDFGYKLVQPANQIHFTDNSTYFFIYLFTKGQKYENIFMAIKKKTHVIIKAIMISKFMRKDNLEKER